ncbi:MAG: Rab family GTPase [Promethearchaeota archaeon]
MKDLHYRFKIIVAGDGGVGKTTLIYRYVDGTFKSNTSMTIGIQFHQKFIDLNDNTTCELLLWDLGGQDHFRAILKRFVKGSHGALLMFDLSRIITLFNLDEWMELLSDSEPDIPIVLIGGKADLLEKGVFPYQDKLLEFKEKYNFENVIFVSSKTGENVNEVFEFITKEIIKSHDSNDK